MLRPIREELDFGEDVYESLDEAEIDVTLERVEDARRQNLPFDHFMIMANVEKQRPETPTDHAVEHSEVSESKLDAHMAEEPAKTAGDMPHKLPPCSVSGDQEF